MNALAKNAGGLWIAAGSAAGTLVGVLLGYASVGLALGVAAVHVAGFIARREIPRPATTPRSNSCIVSRGWSSLRASLLLRDTSSRPRLPSPTGGRRTSVLATRQTAS